MPYFDGVTFWTWLVGSAGGRGVGAAGRLVHDRPLVCSGESVSLGLGVEAVHRGAVAGGCGPLGLDPLLDDP